MKKIIEIEGMQCEHCKARVENTLNAMEGVKASVNLAKKQAVVSLSKDIEDTILKEAISEAGYEVTSITEKKGLFGM